MNILVLQLGSCGSVLVVENIAVIVTRGIAWHIPFSATSRPMTGALDASSLWSSLSTGRHDLGDVHGGTDSLLCARGVCSLNLSAKCANSAMRASTRVFSSVNNLRLIFHLEILLYSKSQSIFK